jgi:hypothetical protein
MILFVTISHFHPSLTFADKAGAFPSGATICRTGVEVANTLAYYGEEFITALEGVIVQRHHELDLFFLKNQKMQQFFIGKASIRNVENYKKAANSAVGLL